MMMRKILLLFFIFTITVFSQQRRVILLEAATNTSCPDCANEDPALQEMIRTNFGTIIPVQFHGWWPGPDDPMYTYNIEQNTDRINYYSWNYVPIVTLDGTLYGEPRDPSDIRNVINEMRETTSPVSIKVSVNKDNDSVKVGIELEGVGTISAENIKLRTAIVERQIEYDNPPGSNGMCEFEYVMRKILPSSDGIDVGNITPGMVKIYQVSVPFDPVWNLEEVTAVCWLQSDDTKEILQSATDMPTFRVEYSGAEIEWLQPNQTYEKEFTINNDNLVPLNLKIKPVIYENTGNWGVSILSQSANYDSLNVTIQPGETYTGFLYLSTTDSNGEITVSVFAENLDDPHGYGNSFSYFGWMKSAEMIFVDNDGGGGMEYKYIQKLDYFGVDYTVIERNLFDALFKGTSNLPFNSMIFHNGGNPPDLTTDEISILTNFLDNGGKLLVSGQEFGSDIFEPAGGSNFPEAQSFVNNYLGAEYIGEETSLFSMEAVPGVDWLEGLWFNLNTAYERRPDAIKSYSQIGNEIIAFTDTTLYSGVTVDNGTYQSVYLTFSLEQLIPSSKATELMRGILSWFDIISDAADEAPEIPSEYSLEQNYPNPFNPSTIIQYEIPNEEFISLKVFDILGREVAELVNEQQNAGNYSVSFNASGFASGIYFYVLKAGAFKQARKMLLLR